MDRRQWQFINMQVEKLMSANLRVIGNCALIYGGRGAGIRNLSTANPKRNMRINLTLFDMQPRINGQCQIHEIKKAALFGRSSEQTALNVIKRFVERCTVIKKLKPCMTFKSRLAVWSHFYSGIY